MKTRMLCLAGVLAVAAALPACRDSSAPSREATPAGPRFDRTPPSEGTHFVGNGGYALLHGISRAGDESTEVYLDVSRAGPTNAPKTFLFFGVYRCRAGECTVQSGNGSIPNQDFSGNQSAMHLHVNTAAIPGFTNDPGPGGLVDVDWRADGTSEVDQTGGMSTFRYGTRVMQRSQGSYRYASAAATGSILGVAIPPAADAQIGVNHTVSVEIDLTR